MVSDSPTPHEQFELLYATLHRIAERAMAGERRNHTLQATALLNEAWLRLAMSNEISPEADQASVVHTIVRTMRRILIDYGRRRAATKRGGRRRRVPLDRAVDVCVAQNLDMTELHDCLDALSRVHERPATVIALRFLFGWSVKETAELLDVSEGTIENDFRLARAWLHKELKEAP
jgi:RNA polymerase sigma factor (TIGR02999 family)